MKRPVATDGSGEFFNEVFDEGRYNRALNNYIDYLEEELDFYRRGGAQILDKDKDE